MHDFSNCTVLLPFMVDNSDRIFNLNEVLKYLNTVLKTEILLVQQCCSDSKKVEISHSSFPNLDIKHILYINSGIFHKTKLYNMGLVKIKTPIVISLDSDVLLPINQLLEAKHNLENGIDYCFPFSGKYVEITKLLPEQRSSLLKTYRFDSYMTALSDYEDAYAKIKIRRQDRHPGLIRNCPPGGCIFINQQVYLNMGMENEDFTGYSPEDAERKHRLQVLGYTTKPVEGNLYHIEHDINHKRITNSTDAILFKTLATYSKDKIKQYYLDKNYIGKYEAIR